VKTLKTFHYIAFILMVVGALNWGLVGAFQFNLVTTVFKSVPSLVTLIYILVGISALFEAVTHKQHCKYCAKS
jgi:uncharacterized membrane protein YuzA (DUF378 family)